MLECDCSPHQRRRRRGSSGSPSTTAAVAALMCLGAVVLGVTVLASVVSFQRSTSTGEKSFQLEDINTEDDDGWFLPAPPGRRRRSASDDLDHHSSLVRLSSDDIRRELQNVSDCALFGRIRNLTFLGSGWTKAVYQGTATLEVGHPPHSVAVKVVDRTGRDVRQCVTSRSGSADAQSSASDLRFEASSELHVRCLSRVERKLLKEAYTLRALTCQHVIELVAVCVPPASQQQQQQRATHSAVPGVAMVTELGAPVDIIQLLQMSWEDRLKVCYSLTQLLHCLAHSGHGSVAVNDFRRQQFVMVPSGSSEDSEAGESLDIRLSDVDDVGFDEQRCTNDDQCIQQLDYDNRTLRVQCTGGRCVGLNEQKNIANAGRHFVSFLLSPGVPGSLRHLVDDIVAGYSGAAQRTTAELLALFERLVDSYRSGDYLKTVRENRQQASARSADYTVVTSSDLPGLYDYRCRYSIAASGCTLTVHDVIEARDLCDFDPQCQAFVLSSKTSWTGRHYVHLKSNMSSPSFNLDTTLYVRTSDPAKTMRPPAADPVS